MGSCRLRSTATRRCLTAASELQTQGMRLRRGPQARRRIHEHHSSTKAQAKPKEDGRARRASKRKASVSENPTFFSAGASRRTPTRQIRRIDPHLQRLRASSARAAKERARACAMRNLPGRGGWSIRKALPPRRSKPVECNLNYTHIHDSQKLPERHSVRI